MGMGMDSRDLVVRARLAVSLLRRGRLHEPVPAVRDAELADLGTLDHAVSVLSSVLEKLDIATTSAKAARDAAEEMGSRLAGALDEADDYRRKFGSAQNELAATRAALAAAEEALAARVRG